MHNTMRVYLGCDTGEANDDMGREIEDALMDVVDAVSIACGGHAGDIDSMHRILQLASERGVLVGAHPSYPDREHFGRRTMDIDRGVLGDSITKQLETLKAIAGLLGVHVSYFKAHGALYHDIAQDPEMCKWVWELCDQVLIDVRIVLPIGSPSIEALRSRGARVMIEGFCDRRYRTDGTLVSRQSDDAMITDPYQAATQAAKLIHEHGCDLLCVHSDTENALAIAQAVRDQLSSLPN